MCFLLVRERFIMNVTFGLVSAEPIVTQCNIPKVPCPSTIDLEAASVACKALALTCTFFLHNSTEFGDVDESGRGTGIIGAIQRGLYDTSSPTFTPTYRRLKAVDFSNVYFFADILITTRAPDRKVKALDLSIFHAFRWETWLGMAFVMAMVSAMRALGRHAEPQKSDFRRVAAVSWSFGTLVLSSAYTSALFSNRLIGQENLPYKNFESLVLCLEEGRCRLITHSMSSSYLQVLTGSENALGRRIQATFATRPPILRKSSLIPKTILEEEDIFLVWLSSKDSFHAYVAGMEGCQLYVMDAPTKDVWAFPVRKKSPLLRRFNKVSVSFRESGLSLALQARRWTADRCEQLKHNEVKRDDFRSANAVTMYFYGIGVSIAVGALGMEWLWNRRRWRSVRF